MRRPSLRAFGSRTGHPANGAGGGDGLTGTWVSLPGCQIEDDSAEGATLDEVTPAGATGPLVSTLVDIGAQVQLDVAALLKPCSSACSMMGTCPAGDGTAKASISAVSASSAESDATLTSA